MRLVRTTTWWVYECPPIDEWEGAIGIGEYLSLLGERGESVSEIEDFVLRYEGAVEAVACLTTWEGDGAWIVSTLPDVDRREMRVMFIVKQRSDGLVFIASTCELPWLARYEELPGTPYEPKHPERARPVVKRIRELERQIIEQRRRQLVH